MKNKIFIVFAVAVLLMGIVRADFLVDKNSSFVEKKYFGGDFIRGKLNISFSDQGGSSLFESGLGGSAELINVLIDSGYVKGADFFCSPTDCEVDYVTAGVPGNEEIEFNLDSKRTFGFVLNGEEVKVDSLDFEIFSSAPVSCNNQIFIDFFDDGGVDFYNTKYKDVACGEREYGCFNGDIVLKESLIPSLSGGRQVCEKVTLPPAAAYRIGAKVNGTGTSRVGAWLLNSDGKPACGSSANPIYGGDMIPLNGEVNVISRCSFIEEFTGMICVFDNGPGDDYRIKFEEDSNSCGVKIESGKVVNVSVDYEIFAQPLAYDEAGWIDAAETHLQVSGESLRRKADKYILERYNRTCTGDCYIPLSVWRGDETDRGLNQNLKIRTTNNKFLRYTSASSIVNERKINSLFDGDFNINSNFILLDIEKMEFEVPETNGSRNFKLTLGGDEVLVENILAEVGYSFSVSPRFALLGGSTAFTISSLENITSSAWNFGDGSPVIVKEDNKATHTFTKEGTYFIQVEATNEVGIDSTKRFKVVVGEPKVSASLLLTDYTARLQNIKAEIENFPEWTKVPLEKELKVREQETKLRTANNKLEAFGAATKEEEYISLIGEVLELDIPLSIFTSDKGEIPGEFGLENIDVGLIDSLSDDDISNPGEVKEGVLVWINNNYDFNIKYETVSAREDESQRKVLRLYSVVLTKKVSGSDDNSYLLINYPKDSLTFKNNYEVRELEDENAVAIPIDRNGDPNVIEFLIGGVNSPNADSFGIYISPPLEDLEVVDKTYGGFRSDTNEFLWLRFAVSMSLLLIIFIFVYVLLQTWYKKYYEKHLFKNGNDLYNLVNYIYNSRKIGIIDKDIKEKLKGKNWKGEQITYAFKKIDGKRTGMWEIPLFKFAENRRVKREIEKRQGRPIDVRFVKRPNL